jgi:predicted NBD/HSP70 family sugar kinase
MKKYITQGKIKQKNLSDILLYILEKGETSRREIERETGFSWGTVSESVMELLSRGYVTEEKSARTGQAGRNTQVLKPSGEKIAAIGVDVNLSGMGATVLGFDRSEKARFFRPFTAKTQEETLNLAISIADEAMAFCKDKYTVMAIGLAFQGGVDAESGVSIRFPKIENWMPVCVKELFERRYGIYTRVEHDPKCMLIGQMQIKRYDNCVLLRVDGGIGMAISLDGVILDDTDRFELGHTLTVPNGKICSCGKRGCLEMYGSLSALDGSADNPENELRTAGKYLSAALYNTYVMLKPESLILTGKAASLPAFTESALSLLDGCEIDICVDPDISAAYGAAVEAIKSAVRSFFI